MDKQGKILSHVCDQGHHGSSWCSECDTKLNITKMFRAPPKPLVCPGCGCSLTFGEVTYNEGGSDF